MVCHGRWPCEAAWPRLMRTRSLWSSGHVLRRASLYSVLCSAAPAPPSPEVATPTTSRDPQDGLLSIRQLVRTYGARSGDQRWFASSAAASASTRSPSPGAAASALLHAELLESARLSKLAGLCYWPHDQLAERLQAEGLELVAQGSNYFTSWYVCDADDWSVPPSAASQPSAAAATANSRTHATSISVADGSTGPPASATQASTGPGRRHGGVRRRLVLLRGVTWFAADVESVRVWGLLVRACTGVAPHMAPNMQHTASVPSGTRARHETTALTQMRAWPTPFMESGTRQPGELLAHAGVAEMASHMYDVLLPYLATAEPCHLTFAGADFGVAVIIQAACTKPTLTQSCGLRCLEHHHMK